MSIDNITPAEWDALNRNIKPKVVDMVNHPPHYTVGEIECIDYIRQQLGSGFYHYCLGQVYKYLHRHEFKGSKRTDLEKANFYFQLMLEEVANAE